MSPHRSQLLLPDEVLTLPAKTTTDFFFFLRSFEYQKRQKSILYEISDILFFFSLVQYRITRVIYWENLPGEVNGQIEAGGNSQASGNKSRNKGVSTKEKEEYAGFAFTPQTKINSL